MTSPLTSAVNKDRPRIAWIDAAKGYGIVLVVVGHVLRGLVRADIVAQNAITQSVDRWIYSFHMPLFFFLSGLLLIRPASNNLVGFATNKIRTIAYPYLVWSTLTILIKSAMGTVVNHPLAISVIPSILIWPVDQFWFLYTLLLCILVLGFLLWLGLKPGWLVLFTVIALPGIAMLPLSNWPPLNAARYYAFFLALGVASRTAIDALQQLRLQLVVSTVLGFLAVTVVSIYPAVDGSTFIAPIVAVLGTMAVVGLSGFTEGTRASRICEYLGRFSLEIYVAHTIGSAGGRILLLRVAHIGNPTIHLVVGIVAGLALPLAFAMVLKRAGVNYVFTWPKRRHKPAEISAVSS